MVPVMVFLVVALGACIAVAGPGDTAAASEAAHAEIRSRIESDDIEGALQTAEQYLRAVRNSADAKPFSVVDAEWLVRTVRLIGEAPGDCSRILARSDSLQAIIDSVWQTGDFQKGREAAELRLDLTRRCLGIHPHVAHSLDELGGFMDELGEPEAGELLCRRALALRESMLTHEHPDVALNLTNLSCFAYGRGDYREALELTEESTRLYRLIFDGDNLDLATSLGNEALYQQYLGNYEAAGELFRASIAMQERLLGPDNPELYMVIDNFACLYADMGEYAQSEVLHRKALKLVREAFGDDHAHVARLLSNLSIPLMRQGDYAGAERLLVESLEIFEDFFGPGHARSLVALNNLSQLYFDWAQYETAEKLQRRSVEICRKHTPDHPHLALCLDNHASTLYALGRYDEAEVFFREALDRRRALFGNDHLDTASTLHNLGTLLRMQGRHLEAEEALLDAQRIYDEALGVNHTLRSTNLFQLGQIHRARGGLQEAESLLAEAAGVYEIARLETKTGLRRAWFGQSPHESLAGTRCELGLDREAWEAVEHARARSLADMLFLADERDLTPREVAREDSLKRVLVDLEGRLIALHEASRDSAGTVSPARLSEARSGLLDAEAAWAQFQAELARKYPMSEGAIFALERVQASLDDDSALIGWLDLETRAGGHRSWGYVVRDSGQVFWADLDTGGASDAGAACIDALCDCLLEPDTPTAAWAIEGHGVWRQRVLPLLPALEDVDRLIVIPAGLMSLVPLEALVDSVGVRLVEQYTVTYAPSATVHAWLIGSVTDTGVEPQEEASATRAARRALLIGDPLFSELEGDHATDPDLDGDAFAAAEPTDPEVLRRAVDGDRDALDSLPRLPAARRELTGIARVHGNATLLDGADAAEARLDALARAGELAEFGVIHFATHAIIDDRRPERSALVLSQVGLPDPLEAAMAGEPIYDGLLTAKEMLHGWSLHSELVALSACETAVGTEVKGEGHVGFAHVLIQTGARSLIVGLWKVDDTATSLLMHRFYENWLGEHRGQRADAEGSPTTKAEALREAKLWLSALTDETGERPYKHPYYWAGFVLIGDPS
jgi:CHAT domain-containing protein/tetratricopeptide (TPR) repeat protein